MSGGRKGLGFPRRARLLVARDFERVFASSERSASPAFTVLARPNGRREGRLGLAISRKVLPRAAHRNRVKRLIRESFRHHQQGLAGLDLVVLGRSGLAGLGNRELRKMLEAHWQQIARGDARPPSRRGSRPARPGAPGMDGSCP